MKISCAHTKVVDVSTLVENPMNPNKHPERQIELLAKILKFQGWRNPIVVSKRSGFVVSGHGRLLAAKKNGWQTVPVDEQDFENEAAEYAHLIADNKIHELADHDDKKMIEDIQSLGVADFELLGLDNFVLPDFAPGSMDDQGQLDEKKLVFMICPHCEEKFEQGQAAKFES